MDWLTRHYVLIDCAHDTLVFWAPEQLPVKTTIWRKSNGEGIFMGEKLEVIKREKEDLGDGGKKEDEEPFSLSEVRNDWTYHVRKDIFTVTLKCNREL